VDIAVAGPSGFAVLLNDGHGGFLSATNYDTNVWGWEVLQADINGDGNVDIVVVQGQSHYLSIFLGNGNGTFTQQPDIDLAAYGPTGITAADLNADGKMDLAVSVDDWTNAVGILVLLGNGNGTFQAPTLVVSSDQQHSWPGEVKAVDINQDGKVDLVYADTGLGTVGILFGKGDGTFFASVDYPLNPNPFALALADLNGDGTLDAVVSSLSFPGMTVSLNSSGSVVALDSAPNPSAVSESVTFTATVSATVTGAKSGPTGSVTFSEGVSVLGVAPISAGAATAQLSNLSIGSHSIIASYPGDSNFQAASSAAIVQVVSKSSSQVNLVSSLNPSISGQSVIFTASVSSATAGVTLSPSGSVMFKDGSTVLGTATIVLGNVTFTASNLSVGSHSITASYSGDASFQSSTSTALTQIVNAVKNGSQTTLSSSLNPTTSGQTVIFTATVAASTQGVSTIPSGTVTFSDGVTALGTSNLAAGQATLTVSTLSVGSHAITATYSGDSAFLTSTSTVLTQVVSSAKTASVTTLASSANPANSRQSITFTATVASGVGSVNTTPTGSVVFQDGGASLGSRTLSGGKATLKVSDMLAGTHVITAVYSGDATFAASTGTLNQVIVRGNESAADFSFTTSAPALAVTVGRSGALTLGVASVNSFSGTVSLSCGQLPAGISCQPSPASLSVASGQSLNSQLTITVAPTFVASKSDGRSRRGSIGIFLASGLLGFFGLVGSLRRKRRTLSVAVAIVTLTFMLALTGCGGTSQGPPASTTQTLQVTATAPAAIQGGTPIVHSLNITLTIQQ